MPNLSFSWVITWASSALRSSAFDGMHPTLRQTPPQYFASMTAAFRPSWEARMAATYPPGPAPRTTTSKSLTNHRLLQRPKEHEGRMAGWLHAHPDRRLVRVPGHPPARAPG